jgi:ribosome-binding protein aMBF1 (putative translation factor)
MEYSPSKLCWICGTSIALEGCKVDERGLPVHEDCYVAKVARRKNTAPQVDQTLPPNCTGSDTDDSRKPRGRHVSTSTVVNRS